MPAWLRWVLVLPAAACGPVSIAAAYLLLDAGLMRICPESQRVSGACIAEWYPLADLAATCASFALGALLTVLLGALAAPSRRLTVAVGLMALGAACAAYTLHDTGPSALPYVACALLAGAVGVWMVRRREART